jgi:microcystin degradation protein MlrC
MVKLPLLVAGEAAVTEVEPARSLYAGLEELETTYGVLGASILIGCAWTDSPHTAVAAVVSSADGPAAEGAARALAARVWERRDEFAVDSAIAELPDALRMAAEAGERPVFISDSGDNTTAGAAGDSPYVLQYLVEHEAAGALVAGITDPAAAAACAEAGAGATVGLSLGGKVDAVHFAPFACHGVVRNLAAGSAEARAHAGARAVVRIGGVDTVIQSDRRPFTELQHFHDVGLDPGDYEVVVVKEGYLFPELRDYAPLHIMGLTPGFADQRLDRLPFSRLSRPIHPLDEGVSWST